LFSKVNQTSPLTEDTQLLCCLPPQTLKCLHHGSPECAKEYTVTHGCFYSCAVFLPMSILVYFPRLWTLLGPFHPVPEFAGFDFLFFVRLDPARSIPLIRRLQEPDSSPRDSLRVPNAVSSRGSVFTPEGGFLQNLGYFLFLCAPSDPSLLSPTISGSADSRVTLTNRYPSSLFFTQICTIEPFLALSP